MKTNRRKFIQNAGLSAAALGFAPQAIASTGRSDADKDVLAVSAGTPPRF